MEDEKLEAFVNHLSGQGFDLGEELGSGAYGTVFRAEQPSLGRSVAVKFLSGLAVKDPTNRKRAQQEARLLARLEHPNIPFVITTGIVGHKGKLKPSDSVTAGTPYFVMQFISGERLDRLLERKKIVHYVEAVSICQSILSALTVAHQHEIVHRDVRPSNIIITKNSPILIDFSLGMCQKYEQGFTRNTGTGQALGTWEYVSPEQKKDASSVDHRTDVYSAGVTLFEMLAGHPRWQAHEQTPELPNTPAGMMNIIRHACAAIDERYQTAAEFSEALAAYAQPQNTSIRGTAICPTSGCELGSWSQNGYFRGPRLLSDTVDKYCQSCGEALIRNCPKCERAIPVDIRDFVVTETKSGPDRTCAYCAQCGAQIYAVPLCLVCGSFLRAIDLNSDTSDGCSKCKTKGSGSTGGYGGGGYSPEPYDPGDYSIVDPEDDDIPF